MMNAGHWLMATAASAILGAMATMIAFQFGRRKLGFLLACAESLAGFVCATVVAVLLAGEDEPGPLVVNSPVCNWFSFPGPRALEVGFGLETSGIKASLIGLIGLMTFIALVNGYYRKQKPLSDHVILAISLLYPASVVFVFAPNLAQALLGWAGISLLSGILIRLTKLQSSSDQTDTRGELFSTTESRGNQNFAGVPNRRGRSVTASLDFLERFFVERLWRALTIHLPASIAEQMEIIEATSISFQLAATTLCTFAVLLTWLMVSV